MKTAYLKLKIVNFDTFLVKIEIVVRYGFHFVKMHPIISVKQFGKIIIRKFRNRIILHVYKIIPLVRIIQVK